MNEGKSRDGPDVAANESFGKRRFLFWRQRVEQPVLTDNLVTGAKPSLTGFAYDTVSWLKSSTNSPCSRIVQVAWPRWLCRGSLSDPYPVMISCFGIRGQVHTMNRDSEY